MARRAGRVAVIAACLAAVPAELRQAPDFGLVGIGMAGAMAQSRTGGIGGGNASERSAPAERGIDRNDRSGQRDREASGRGRSDSTPVSRSLEPAESPPAESPPAESPPAVAIGPPPVMPDNEPGIAPTEAGTARIRAMVEIAKEMGAVARGHSDHLPITGPVTQEMLDLAERAYVAAVHEAWESHGFPWNDPDVLRSLGELEVLVSAQEDIIEASGHESGHHAGITIAPDFNHDGFVDINDLWDAHLQ